MEPETDEYVDPQITELLERVGVLEREVATLKESAALRLINDFKQAEDGNGELKHPRFEELRQVMGDLIISGHVNSLESAYQMAERIQGNN